MKKQKDSRSAFEWYLQGIAILCILYGILSLTNALVFLPTEQKLYFKIHSPLENYEGESIDRLSLEEKVSWAENMYPNCIGTIPE